MYHNPLTNRIVDFLTSIGVQVRKVALETNTFLPEILVDKGRLLVDEAQLIYPGAHLLATAGLCAIGDVAQRLGVEPYPHMIKWLRD